MAQQLDTREVQVSRTNGHGFQVSTGDWLNFSKYAKPEDITMPSTGETVTVYLDKAGFVRRVAKAEKTLSPGLLPSVSMVSAPIAAATSTTPAHIEQDARGVVITRLACINSATAILATGGGAATPDEVVALAERLEAWATR